MLDTMSITNILSNEDIEEILIDMLSVVKTKLDNKREMTLNLFMENLKDNLHVVMAFSPVGNSLRLRFRNVNFFNFYYFNLFF